MNKIIDFKNFKLANHLPFTLIAGPCQMESKEHALEMVERLVKMCQTLNINFIYKTSFDKANRTNGKSKRGVGLEKSLEIFQSIRDKFQCPLLTDVHKEEQCAILAQVVDVLQIPAFLCRQTDLLKAAALTGKIINVKKGQFMAPWDMVNAISKLKECGNEQVTLTDRGATFGYNNLVTDMRSLVIMAKDGTPVIIDATHSVQKPGGMGDQSGGEREFVPVIARAAVAVGVAGVFIETHQDPDNAPSDGSCMMKIDEMPALLEQLIKIDRVVKNLN